MSPEEPAREPEARAQGPRLDAGGRIVILSQPEELGYPIRREEFEILCEGEVHAKDKEWRNILIGITATAGLALLEQIATTEWGRALELKKWLVFMAVFVEALVFLSSIVISVYLHFRVRRRAVPSGYVRMKQKISTYFEQRGAH